MSDKAEGMKSLEKFNPILTVAGILIAFAVLVFGDNLLKSFSKPDIYLYTDGVSLDGLGSTKEHVQLFDFFNAGAAASSNIKVVIKFANSDIRFKAESDEEIRGKNIKDSSIEVSLDRFSPRSHIKISVVSKSANPVIETYYVDDEGKSKVDRERKHEAEIDWFKLFVVLVIVILVLIIAWQLSKSTERSILKEISDHNVTINDRLNEVKAGIAELGFVQEQNLMQDVSGNEEGEDKEVSHRLRKLLSPKTKT